MQSVLREESAVGVTMQQVSTRVAFFIAGFCLGVWAPLVPYAKARTGLDEAQLGFLLLCLGGGSMLTMPFSGGLAARLGCRRIIAVASLVLACCLPLLATLSNVPALALTLLIFGAFLGPMDVTMNIQATIVEKASGRAMMSGFHGMFSLGGLIGAVLMSGLLGLSLTPLVAVLFPTAIILMLLARFARNLLGYGLESEASHFVWPRGKVLLIGALCFIAFMAEGAILDWGAIFLRDLRGVATAYAGLGYAAFAVAMTAGRLGGDYLVEAFGNAKILIGGGLCATLGLGLVVMVPWASVDLFGFILVGLGASNLAPVFFVQAGRQKAMPAGAAIASITTMGYVGALAGPASIGFLAHLSNLAIALGVVALLLLAVPATAKIVLSEA